MSNFTSVRLFKLEEEILCFSYTNLCVIAKHKVSNDSYETVKRKTLMVQWEASLRKLCHFHRNILMAESKNSVKLSQLSPLHILLMFCSHYINLMISS